MSDLHDPGDLANSHSRPDSGGEGGCRRGRDSRPRHSLQRGHGPGPGHGSDAGHGRGGSGSRPLPEGLADPGRVLIWDLDGTIADTRADIATGILEMLRELRRPPLDPTQVIRNVGRGVRVLVAGCLADTGEPARDGAEIEHGVAVFRSHYWRHLMDTTVPFPGMSDILCDLSLRGRSMAIVSNKPEDATREILRRMGLLDCFVAVLGGDSLPVRKPDPAPLLRALRLCLAASDGLRQISDGTSSSTISCRPSGHAIDKPDEDSRRAVVGGSTAADDSFRDIAPGHAAMIGDSLPDVQAARAAGMPICGVAWGFDPDGEMRRAELDCWFENVEELGRAVRG